MAATIIQEIPGQSLVQKAGRLGARWPEAYATDVLDHLHVLLCHNRSLAGGERRYCLPASGVAAIDRLFQVDAPGQENRLDSGAQEPYDASWEK